MMYVKSRSLFCYPLDYYLLQGQIATSFIHVLKSLSVIKELKE